MNLLALRHPLVTYFGLAYTISWACWLSLILLGLSGGSGIGALLFVGGVFGPAIAGLSAAAATGGRRGVRELLSRLGRWRVGLHWYLVAIFGPFIVTLTAIELSRLLGATPVPSTGLIF